MTGEAQVHSCCLSEEMSQDASSLGEMKTRYWLQGNSLPLSSPFPPSGYLDYHFYIGKENN